MRHPLEEAPRAGVARALSRAAERFGFDRESDDQRGRLARQLRDSGAFLRGFLADPGAVGSVIPSSHALEQRIVRSARLDGARTVVELGPGTGGTTRAFLEALPAHARLLAIELSPTFAARLARSIDDPRLAIECGSAERIAAFLEQHRMGAPDAVISGIPFSTMPQATADRIAAELGRLLAPGGRFVAYQVRAHVAGYASRYLGAARMEWEFVNVPPVRVFTWVRRT